MPIWVIVTRAPMFCLRQLPKSDAVQVWEKSDHAVAAALCAGNSALLIHRAGTMQGVRDR